MVMKILKKIDPEGTNMRKARSLRRRNYISEGPNWPNLHDIFSLRSFHDIFYNFLLMKNITRCMLDTEVKVFHILWNDPETVFHEMPWKKNFIVYPSLKIWFLLARQTRLDNTKFLLTHKKNKVSSYKRWKYLR